MGFDVDLLWVNVITRSQKQAVERHKLDNDRPIDMSASGGIRPRRMRNTATINCGACCKGLLHKCVLQRESVVDRVVDKVLRRRRVRTRLLLKIEMAQWILLKMTKKVRLKWIVIHQRLRRQINYFGV